MPTTTRRGALKLIGLGFGGAAIAPSVLLTACKEAATTPGYSYQTFSELQAATLRLIQDAILPKTDTPSASEVGSVEFTDVYITHALTPEERETMLYGLDRFRDKLKTEHNVEVEEATPEQVEAMMDTYFVNYEAPTDATDDERTMEIEGNTVKTAPAGGMDTSAVAAAEEGAALAEELGGSDTTGQGKVVRKDDATEINGVLTGVRWLTIESYFQSEQIGENVLNYLEVPGQWHGQVPMSEIPGGKAYSL